MTLLEKIDAVFEWLFLNSGKNPTLWDIKNGLDGKNIEIGEIRDILIKLKTDGFLLTEYNGVITAPYDDHGHFLINFNGKYFHETVGSFTEKIRRENLNLANLLEMNQRTERNERALTLWTRRLTYGTVAGAGLIVLWDMYKTFCLHLH